MRELGKTYRLAQLRRPDTLVHRLADLGRSVLSRSVPAREDFCALKDVTFNIDAGETVGIIGRNGAGKSTLLKILSRVSEPSAGTIRLRGRVASLLEVGTGFHPDLTARHNIYLNGAILGMKRKEIDARFDRIADFAGTGQFLDEPVRHLSSGMYIRLAFAVAIHLESEILIVDEVLAVGDAAFQQRCIEHIRRAAANGRTILFVSHDLSLVSQLTKRTIVLESGRVAFDGPTMSAMQHYLDDRRRDDLAVRRPVAELRVARRYRAGDGVTICEIGFASGQSGAIAPGGNVRLELVLETLAPQSDLRILYSLNNLGGQPVLTGVTPPFATGAGTQAVVVSIESLNLVPGEYDFTMSLGKGGLHEGKIEYDAFGGFGRLVVADDGGAPGAFGYWRNEWGSVFHRNVGVELIARP